MKSTLIRRSLAALALCGLLGSVQAATVTVTQLDDPTEVNLGAPGSFYWALTNAQSGDTIAFNVPGAGPHYFQVPTNGFPLIYHKYNLTIDGYTQPGSSPNTHPITNANNANIQIVIDGRNGGCRDMRYNQYGTTITSDPPIDNTASASEGTPYGNNEQAILGIYRSTNINIRGLSVIGSYAEIKGTGSSTGNQKGIVMAQDYGGDTNIYATGFGYTNGITAWIHINGCWLGVDPTNVTGVCTQRINITAYDHGSKNGRPDPELAYLTVGVASNSPNARAEFNVIVGGGCGADVYSIRQRFCGNFWGVLPDGVTAYNPIALGAYWRGNGWIAPESGFNDTVCNYIGTDGDGVNDADEGNLFGPLGASPQNGTSTIVAEINGSGDGMPWVIAGNRFGIAVDGTIWTNNSYIVLDRKLTTSGCQVRFGSDFNGVSDNLEANVLYNNNNWLELYNGSGTGGWGTPVPGLFKVLAKSTVQKDCWLSCRGNIMVNNFEIYDPTDSSANWKSAANYPVYCGNFMTDSLGDQGTVPAIGNSTSVSTLVGTFSPPNTGSYYTNDVIVDLYVADPQGIANGMVVGEAFFGGSGSYSPTGSGWGWAQGTQHLGSYRVPNPASGAFSFDISSLGLAHGTVVTLTVTYSSFQAPNITSISHSGGNTTLTWTGDDGGPLVVAGHGGATSGFGLQSAASLSGPWTTTYAAGNSATVAAAGSASYYRVSGPVSGPTTIFAPAYTMP